MIGYEKKEPDLLSINVYVEPSLAPCDIFLCSDWLISLLWFDFMTMNNKALHASLPKKENIAVLDQNLPVLFHSSTVNDKYDVIYSH